MSLPPSTTDKAALRRLLLERRKAIDPAERPSLNRAIGASLERWLAQHAITRLGVYWPIRHEPDLLSWYAILAERQIELALPCVVGPDAPLQFAAWKPGDAMIKDTFGVPVPAQPAWVALPQALLVPCVGFNAHGFRLGYGGGFYDRTLAVDPKPLTVGIAYSCLLAEFDIGPHDIALDVIITDAS